MKNALNQEMQNNFNLISEEKNEDNSGLLNDFSIEE